jgi:hypothetical protein
MTDHHPPPRPDAERFGAPEDYCRQIETYLCRKNDGHLVRIVGPAFEQVRGWAQLGVPLRVAFSGIDRYCERYYSKGPRRRPVRIEFCEDDVLDAFDEWRRAVGVRAVAAAADTDGSDEPEAVAHRKGSLSAHIERVLSRLGSAGESRPLSEAFVSHLAGLGEELRTLEGEARQARGENRARLLGRLAALDRDLMNMAAAEADPVVRDRLRHEAAEEIEPFAGRMPVEARMHAVEAAERRLLRETLGLPVVSFE